NVLGGNLGASDRCTPRASHCPANRPGRVLCEEVTGRHADERKRYGYPTTESMKIDLASIHLHLLLSLYRCIPDRPACLSRNSLPFDCFWWRALRRRAGCRSSDDQLRRHSLAPAGMII